MEYGKYETLARYGYTGAARPQGDWQTSAALTRQQYDDWRTRYLPRVARLADLGENNSLMNAQLARVAALPLPVSVQRRWRRITRWRDTG
ncbi:hypothetical protein AADD81_004229 [Escherichia coli]